METRRFLPLVLLLCSPLSLPAAQSATPGSGAAAGTEVPRTHVAPLESSLTGLLSDIEMGVLLRVFFANTDEDLGLEINGFDFNELDIWAQTSLDGFDARINVDASDGTLVLEDAYVNWRKDEKVGVRVGSFKPRVLFSNEADPNHLLFNDRTVLGEFFDFWDTGVEASGRLTENFDYYVALTNGDNGPADDSLLVLRGEWSVNGGSLRPREGSRGLQDVREIQIGAVVYDDTGDDETGFGLDAIAHQGDWSAQFEVMSLDDGLGGPSFLDAVPVPLAPDSTPWALTGSFLTQDGFQIAGRLQDTDNATDTMIWSAGVNWFPDATDLAVIGEVAYFEGDDDGLVFQIGTSLGIWRPR